MRFSGAAAVSLLIGCAVSIPHTASAQQPAAVIQPVVATMEASPGQSLPARASMPSHVAGHLADRLQALHDTSAPANADRSEVAARELPADVTKTELKPIASPRTADDQRELLQPPATTTPVTTATAPMAAPPAPTAPAPTASAAPRRNPLADDQPSFGIANPLRGAH